MRLLTLLGVCLAFASLAQAATNGGVISSNGVQVTVASGWHRVRAPSDPQIVDPKTLLVVGTAGVRSRASQCQIAHYLVPPTGAVVVVVGWTTVVPGRGVPKPGRAPLKKLLDVFAPSFECFTGRGALAQVFLHGKLYQVNVMVGARATKQRVAEALAAARSFDLAS